MDVLIIADDLSGAADCAAASGGEAIVTLGGGDDPDARVVAVDIDSRDLAPSAAAARARVAIEARPPRAALVYQKMDSTLRGNWASELAAISAALAPSWSKAPLALLCPAFPERGRTVRNGAVFIDAQPAPAGSIATLLAEAGQSARLVPRGLPPAELRAALFAAVDSGAGIVICDAESRDDLDSLAAASLTGTNLFWSGSAGMMSSLASQLQWPRPGITVVGHAGCVLVVVGSASRLSRRQVEGLAATPGVESIVCTAEELTGGDQRRLDTLAGDMVHAAQHASCVSVSIGEAPATPATAGSALVAGLARLLVPLLPRFGSLVMTGGETARALLAGAGVTAIRILGEIEPGVPFGWTIGALERPVITKAGAFGTPDTLTRAVRALRDAAEDSNRGRA